jgi:membrane protein
MIPRLLGNLERWLFEPPESIYGQPLWKLTRILRYPYGLIRDILRGDLTLRAMSLVYTTLLSIVPLLALSFSVLKGLGVHRDLEPVLYTFLEPLGQRGYDLTNQIMTFVDNVRGDVLGSLGLIFLLYTTVSMIQKVEESFNFVWRVAQPRSLMRRTRLRGCATRHTKLNDSSTFWIIVSVVYSRKIRPREPSTSPRTRSTNSMICLVSS